MPHPGWAYGRAWPRDHSGLGSHSRIAAEREAGCWALLLGNDKGLVCHLEEMDAAEYLDEADAVERPFLYRKIEFFDPMLICARHGESFLLLPAAGLAGSS